MGINIWEFPERFSESRSLRLAPLFALEQVTRANPENIAEGVQEVAVEHLEPTLESVEPVGGREADSATG